MTCRRRKRAVKLPQCLPLAQGQAATLRRILQPRQEWPASPTGLSPCPTAPLHGGPDRQRRRPGVPRRAGRALPQPAEIVHRHRDAALHALQVAAALALTPWLAPGLRWPGSQPGRSSGEQRQAADRRHHRDHPVAGSADPVQPCPVCQERGVIGPSPCLGFKASSP